MKKKYEKPGLYIENFTLSQRIATNCHIHPDECTLGFPTSGDHITCGWNDGDGGITWTTKPTCNQLDNDNVLDDGFGGPGLGCYNNPSGLTALFGAS